MSSYQYRKSHCGDKTVERSSYLHNGISYTGKMSSLYWFSPLICSEEELKQSEPPHCHEMTESANIFLHFSTNSHPWWRHQMETFSALLALCAGNSPITGEFPSQRPETRSFDVFFDLRLNKSLSKQSWGWWFETQSPSLWRHCSDHVKGCLLYPITVLCCRSSGDRHSCGTDQSPLWSLPCCPQTGTLCAAHRRHWRARGQRLLQRQTGEEPWRHDKETCPTCLDCFTSHVGEPVGVWNRLPHVDRFPTQRGSNVATLLPLCVGNPPITTKNDRWDFIK